MAVVAPRAGLDGRRRALTVGPCSDPWGAPVPWRLGAAGDAGGWPPSSPASFLPAHRGQAGVVRGLVALGSYILVPHWLSVLGRHMPRLPTSL